MLFLFVLFASNWWAPPKSAEIEQLSNDLTLVESVGADIIALEVAKCAVDKMRSFHPHPDDLGDQQKSAETMTAFLRQCGVEDATIQIRRLLSEAAPTESEAALDRRTAAAFVFPTMALMTLANEAFEVKYRAIEPEPPIEIPCPSADRPQPDECQRP